MNDHRRYANYARKLTKNKLYTPIREDNALFALLPYHQIKLKTCCARLIKRNNKFHITDLYVKKSIKYAKYTLEKFDLNKY